MSNPKSRGDVSPSPPIRIYAHADNRRRVTITTKSAFASAPTPRRLKWRENAVAASSRIADCVRPITGLPPQKKKTLASYRIINRSYKIVLKPVDEIRFFFGHRKLPKEAPDYFSNQLNTKTKMVTNIATVLYSTWCVYCRNTNGTYNDSKRQISTQSR